MRNLTRGSKILEIFYHLFTKNGKKNENQNILKIGCFVLMTEIGHFQGNSRKNKSRNKSRKWVEM